MYAGWYLRFECKFCFCKCPILHIRASGSKRLANSCMQFAFKARVQEKLKLCIVLKVAKGS